MNDFPSISNEMIQYPVFYRQLVQRKITDFNRVWNRSSLVELPRGSVLHLVDDNFLMANPIVFVPELQNWTFQLKPTMKFLYHVTDPVTGPVNFPERFRLPPYGLIKTIVDFRRKTIQWVRLWKDLPTMPPILASQAMVSYLSLYRAKIIGVMKQVRRFGYVMSSVLNTISKFGDSVEHFIPIPAGNSSFTKADFLMAFKEFTKQAIRRPNDPWYLFLMHLYTFMQSETQNHSMFSQIPERLMRHVHFIVYTKNNFVILNLQNLRDFNKGKTNAVLNLLIRQMNTLASQGQMTGRFDEIRNLSEPEEAPDDIDPETIDVNDESVVDNLTVEKVQPEEPLSTRLNLQSEDNDEVISRPDVKKPEEPTPAMRFSKFSLIPLRQAHLKRYFDLQRRDEASDYLGKEKRSWAVYRAASKALLSRIQAESMPVVKDIRVDEYDTDPGKDTRPPVVVKPATEPTPAPKQELVKSETVEDVMAIPDLAVQEVDSSVVTIQPKLVNNGRTVVNAPAYVKSPDDKKRAEFNATTTDEIDEKAMDVIAKATTLTQAQHDHVMKLAEAYKSIKVGEQTIEEILNSSPDDQVSKNELDFLKGQVPDESMLKSSVANFDKEYMDKFFLKDLVSGLAFFNRVGMFMKDLKITDVSDSQDSKLEIKALYEDMNHKTHTLRFTVPKVDSRGYCFINGGLKVLKKQRITVPICKVSPVRVTLSSDYNKYLVERIGTVAHSFINYIDKIVTAANDQLTVTFGSAKLPSVTFPYEYTAIARKYTTVQVKNEADSNVPWVFHFNDPEKLLELYTASGVPEEVVKDAQDNEDDVKGYLIGIHPTDKPVFVYMKLDGSLVLYNADDGVSNDGTTFIDLLCELCDLEISHLSEWTEFKLLSKSVPVIFALAYRYGLSHMLNYMKTTYAIYDKKARYPRRQSDVIIKFKDKVLVIPRAPLSHSLVFAGLNSFDKALLNYNIEDMDDKNTYFELLQTKKISVHNLKGIDNFFDLFVDPITRDILFRMGEPTEAKDLLIRATTLLTTEDHPPVAASTNYRFRSYERIASAAYKILANTYSTYRYRGIGAGSSFSIRDFEITNMVINDQLMEPVDQINPVNDIKYSEEYGHGGAGGRQSTDTFMVDDRQWPEDGVGIIGESSVDNGKTGYAGNMSNNPSIDNVRGLTITKKLEDIQPSEAFTSTTLLGPCAINDDSKRYAMNAALR